MSQGQSHWLDVAFAVIVPVDYVNITALDIHYQGQGHSKVRENNRSHLPLPADVLQTIFAYQTSTFNSLLGVTVSRTAVLWKDYNAAALTPAPPKEKDLPMTGIVFGGIFGFLFLLTCLASMHKAIK